MGPLPQCPDHSCVCPSPSRVPSASSTSFLECRLAGQGGKVWQRQCLILGGAAWRRDVGQGKGQVHVLLAELGSKGHYNLIDLAGQMGGGKGVVMGCRERHLVSVKKDLRCRKRYALGGVRTPGVRLRKQNSLIKTVPSWGCKWQG